MHMANTFPLLRVILTLFCFVSGLALAQCTWGASDDPVNVVYYYNG